MPQVGVRIHVDVGVKDPIEALLDLDLAPLVDLSTVQVVDLVYAGADLEKLLSVQRVDPDEGHHAKNLPEGVIFVVGDRDQIVGHMQDKGNEREEQDCALYLPRAFDERMDPHATR